ncbi:MAG: TonB-dependent receptor plug, partial [Bacteroidetes bacterium]
MKKRCLGLLWAFFACISIMQAQTTLSGTVTNAEGEPVVGAALAVRTLRVGALSDQEGKYSLSIPGTGTSELSVSAMGYATQVVSVTLGGGAQRLDFRLTEDVFSLDQIVVTGTNTSRTQKEMIASLTQVPARQIQAISPNSMADIMRFVPGVHAEGGGGDVASNIFVRGLPSGGQYKYNPIEEDGMPVQSTGYLTSSAQDVYFRPDLGVAAMEFARGGSSTLFGMGAPLGVFNYISSKGGGEGETTIRLSGGQYNLLKTEFAHGGSAGENWQYHVSGTLRYDEGPLRTGSASRGYQIRANLTRTFRNGYARLYLRSLDDNAQFFLPIPHVKNTTDAATGNDGSPITTLNTPLGGTFSLVNPSGTILGHAGEGVTARGGSVMFEYAHDFGKWNLKSKTRLSRFEHRFDFWSPGKSFEIDAYARS